MTDITDGQVSRQSTMASQPIRKLFWKYTLPAVLGMVINGLYTTVDGIFIGQAVGADGLAAINLAWPIFGIVFGFGLMAGTGTAALYSIERGANKPAAARQIMGNVFVLLPLLSIVLGSFTYGFSSDLLQMQGASGDALQHGTEYLRTISLGSLPAMAGAALTMLVRNDERPKPATVLMSIGALLNILLDWLFVVVLNHQVEGAALATVLSQLVVTVLGTGYFFSSYANERLQLRNLKLHIGLSAQTLVTGLSSFVMFLYFSFVLIIHNRLFLEHGDVTVLAAFAIVGYVQAFYYMFAEGIGHGIQPLVSFNKGAGNNRNIRETLLLALSWAIGTGVMSLLILNLFPELIAGIFINSDPALLEATVTGFRLHLFTLFLDGFIVISAAYFQALALARLATFISMGNMLVQLPLLFILPKWLGVTGVWIAMPLSNIFLAAIVIWLVTQDLRRRKDTSQQDAVELRKAT